MTNPTTDTYITVTAAIEQCNLHLAADILCKAQAGRIPNLADDVLECLRQDDYGTVANMLMGEIINRLGRLAA